MITLIVAIAIVWAGYGVGYAKGFDRGWKAHALQPKPTVPKDKP